MYKKTLKILSVILSITMIIALFAACSSKSWGPLSYTSGGEVASNGGFVVKKGEYVYFINGVETSSADNTFGDPVKGTLVRAKANDVNGTAEIVVPSLMVAGDYTAGVFIYGDYVYYATPTSAKNNHGEVMNTYLDFTRTRLDGTGTPSDPMFRLDSSSAQYRFVEIEGKVFVFYVSSETLNGTSYTCLCSYDVDKGESTILVTGYSAILFNKDVESDYVYYTMAVINAETGDTSEPYNQIYRVRADVKTDVRPEDTVEDEEDTIRVNLGTLVLDGIGYLNTPTASSVDAATSLSQAKSANGFTYTLIAYYGDSLVYSRVPVSSADTNAQVYLYDLSKTGGNTITNNAALNFDAATNTTPNTFVGYSTTDVTASTLFYTDGNDVKYLYVSGTSVMRGTAGVTTVDNATLALGYKNVEGKYTNLAAPALLFLDGDYLYFTDTGTNGSGIFRINYKGADDDYGLTQLTGSGYEPVKLMDIDMSTGWYGAELIDGTLFFPNANTNSYNSFIYTYQIGAKTNDEIRAESEKYNDVTSLIGEVAENANYANASNGMLYYFYTGDRSVFDEGSEHFAEYTERDLILINAFINATNEAKYPDYDFASLKDGETFTNVYSAFVTRVGIVDETSEESHATTMDALLLSPEEEEGGCGSSVVTGGLAFGAVIVLAGAAVILMKRKHNA